MAILLLLLTAAQVSVAVHYTDRTAPISERVADLLGRMTLEEKIAQTYAPYSRIDPAKFPHGVGQLSVDSATGKASSPAEMVRERNRIQTVMVNSTRLGIPASWSQEALHSGATGGTVFPELVTQGSSWDPELVTQIAAAIALEARATGTDVVFSPVLNQWVDSRFGRLQEVPGAVSGLPKVRVWVRVRAFGTSCCCCGWCPKCRSTRTRPSHGKCCRQCRRAADH
eukprot:TRINITY_DN11096_c0_g1_i3.p1 TRINITY_DN11096_c0_g1~~TRINITY_DN11096_c0_g1_i3.p1  ORF type:complete len:226 (-),score=32.02 TRINITY_DN11096_c0_g1_i3:247-924(-)